MFQCYWLLIYKSEHEPQHYLNFDNFGKDLLSVLATNLSVSILIESNVLFVLDIKPNVFPLQY